MFFASHAKEIVSAAVPILLWLLTYISQGRVRLRFGSAHNFTFLIDEPVRDVAGNITADKQTVHTIAYLVRNDGTQPATNVEIVFNVKPRYLNIWPIRHFDGRVEEDGRYSMNFPSLAPKEQLSFHLLAPLQAAPDLLNVRSDQAIGLRVPFQFFPVMPKWRVVAFYVAAFLGLGAAVYLLLQLLQYIVLMTPGFH
ncbi:hypothetical protein [Dyella sp.]|uniref:hypothetical protein n=1 Tax=Dyella sp. TaxID=1869338 RepID=UPI002FDB1DD8